MQENELIVEIIKILSGSLSLLVLVAFGALLLKKYIIIGKLIASMLLKLYELYEKNLKGS